MIATGIAALGAAVPAAAEQPEGSFSFAVASGTAPVYDLAGPLELDYAFARDGVIFQLSTIGSVTQDYRGRLSGASSAFVSGALSGILTCRLDGRIRGIPGRRTALFLALDCSGPLDAGLGPQRSELHVRDLLRIDHRRDLTRELVRLRGRVGRVPVRAAARNERPGVPGFLPEVEGFEGALVLVLDDLRERWISGSAQLGLFGPGTGAAIPRVFTARGRYDSKRDSSTLVLRSALPGSRLRLRRVGFEGGVAQSGSVTYRIMGQRGSAALSP